jgi:hypothetical protein
MTDQKACNKLSYIIHLGSCSSYENNNHYQWSLIPLHSIDESQIQRLSSQIYISCTEMFSLSRTINAPMAGEVGSSAPVPGVIGCPPGVPGRYDGTPGVIGGPPGVPGK